jgi:replicative DNA helicase
MNANSVAATAIHPAHGDGAALNVAQNSPQNPYDPRACDARIQYIVTILKALIAPDQVVELRALDVVEPRYRRPHIVSGYYDYAHLVEMARDALELSPCAKGVYFTFNPLNPDLLSRRSNRTDVASEGLTCDKDVLKRRWLLIDIDPKRLAGVSSTEEERALAWAKAHQVANFLREQSWPVPVAADSGNGFHLLYRIDLPAEDGEIVKRSLQALARFDDEHVTIDRSVYNPARIVRLYGTAARKGDSTPQRPHRFSGILFWPPTWECVPLERLQALAAQAPAPTAKSQTTSRSVQAQHSDTIPARVQACLQHVPPAISGDHGSNPTFRAACLLTKGFAMSVEEALPFLQEYNQRCQPPWTGPELLHKLWDAAASDGPTGFLLGSRAGDGSPVATGFEAGIMDSATLEARTTRPSWLVRNILVADQPVVVGGPKKTLKTSLVIDLAISMGRGAPFLGRFEVPQQLNVLRLSGESGQAAVLDTARRICQARGINLHDCNVRWGFRLPSLSNDVDLGILATKLMEWGIKVVIIDPLYLCLLAGAAEGRQAANMFDMGPLLLRVAQVCLGAGATPVLVHHARKTSQGMRGRDGEPMDLEDLAYPGLGEFARQWLLISRREIFDPDNGEHKLWMRVGGSAGHAGCHALDVREGIMNSEFGGRQWQVCVLPARAAIRAAAREKVEERVRSKEEREAAERERVLEVLNSLTVGKTAPDLAEAAGLSPQKNRVALQELRSHY